MAEPDVSTDCSVIVAVRVRPLNSREKGLGGKTCISVNSEFSNMQVAAVAGKSPHTFTYDHTWDSTDPDADEFASQETVYNDVGKKVLAASFQGYNACIFAYGQTGSGKSFCMMGVPDDEHLQGVIPRLSKDVFDRTKANAPLPDGVESISYTIEVSYLEIYQEHVKCLLNPRKQNLKVREHPITGPYVEDLTKLVVEDYEAVLRLIEEGSSIRMVAATNMNDVSSRSHAIFTLILTQTKVMQSPKGKVAHDTVSKINLVDLAGSERAKSTGATGTRLAEGAQINKSLSTLGLVISGLAEISKRKGRGGAPHVPYRDSTLTWLLKDNLGGNSKTFMISTVSPAEVNHDETLSTLRYADRAKSIVTKARVNEDPNTKLIRQLREELAKYKQKLLEFEDKATAQPPREGLPPAIPVSLHTASRTTAVRRAEPDANDTSKTSQGVGVGSGTTATIMSTPRREDGTMQTPRVPQNKAEAGLMREKLVAMEKLMEEAGMSHEDKIEMSKATEAQRQEVMREMGIKTVHADDKLPHFVNMVLDGGWLVQYVSPGDELILGASDDCGMKLVESGSIAMHAVVRCTSEGATTIAALKGGDITVIIDTPPSEDAPHGVLSPPKTLVITSESEPVALTHGTRVDIGENMFRFVDPYVSEQEKAKRKRQHLNHLKSLCEAPQRDSLVEKEAQQRQHADAVANEAELRRQIHAEILAEQGRLGAESPAAVESEEQRVAIPILKLHEVAGQSNSLLPRQGPGSARRNSFLKAKDTLPSKPLTSRFPNEPMVQIFKQTVVFIGAEGSGKTSVKRCMLKEPGFWERKDVPQVTPTLGVEHSEVKAAVKGQQVVLLLEDLSGNPSYASTVPLCIPDQRCIVVLVWDLSQPYNEDEILGWLDAAMLQTPSPLVLLLGTHRDSVKESDSLVLKRIATAEKAVTQRMKETFRLHREMGSQNPPPRVLASYAVSSKSRSVMNGTKTYKFKELFRVITDAAHDQCLQDLFFPEGNVPSSVLTLARKVCELRSEGTWTVPGSEFKTIAANAAPKYQIDVRELARVMSLLHSWKVLLHFSHHPSLRKQVFTDPLWMYGVLNTLNIYAHYQAALNPRDDVSPKHSKHSDRLLKIFSSVQAADGAGLPFSPAEVFKNDKTNSFFRGILTVPLAVCLFRSHLARINCGAREITRCLRLLLSFDVVYPVIPPSGDACIVPTTPLPPDNDGEKAIVGSGEVANGDEALSALAEQHAPVCFIPTLFAQAMPRALSEIVPLFMAGVRRKVVFKPALPATLFSRLLTRVARCVRRIYVGRVDPLTQDPYCNNFWKDGAWVQDTPTTRAVVWVDADAQCIQVVTNVCNARLQENNSLNMNLSASASCIPPSFQLAEGILKATRSLSAEHPGCSAEECFPCKREGCAGWVEVKEERHIKAPCGACGLEQSVLESEGVLRQDTGAEERSDALRRINDPKLAQAATLLEMGEVDEPTEQEILRSLETVDKALPDLRGQDFADIDNLKDVIEKVVALRESGKEADASQLESAMKALSTRDKLTRSTDVLDQMVEKLTAADALDVTLVQ